MFSQLPPEDEETDEAPVLCTGNTHDGRPCGSRPINGSDRCGSHQRKQPATEFVPLRLTHGGTGVIPRTRQEFELLREVDELSGFDLAAKVATMRVRRLTKKELLAPELKEAQELLQTITIERGIMNGQQFSRTIQERPDIEGQLNTAINTLLKVTVESNKQNAALSVEEQAAQLTAIMQSSKVNPVNLDDLPGGRSDLFSEEDDDNE